MEKQSHQSNLPCLMLLSPGNRLIARVMDEALEIAVLSAHIPMEMLHFQHYAKDYIPAFKPESYSHLEPGIGCISIFAALRAMARSSLSEGPIHPDHRIPGMK